MAKKKMMETTKSKRLADKKVKLLKAKKAHEVLRKKQVALSLVQEKKQKEPEIP